MTEPKHQKDDVNYGHGMPKTHCSVCQHWLGVYRAPGGAARCSEVAGRIGAQMWCKLFKQRST